MLGGAMIVSEKRPRLLDDAVWNKPDSARQFQPRFAPGTSERALLDWLGENEFTVDRAARTATRRVERLPCNELIDVAWHMNDKAVIGGAEAVVQEAGCL